MLRYVITVISLTALLGAGASSQCVECDSLAQAISTADTLEARSLRADTTFDTATAHPVNTMGPSLRFEYESDSSHVTYRVSEFQLNRHQLYLANWCNGQIVNFDEYNEVPIENWTPAQLRARSTTKCFPINAGDTISLFKEHWFFTLGTSGPAWNYYKNPDQLSASVVLVDSVTGSRIATLDTFYMGSTTPSRRPCVYSWYPMYARITYLAPSSIVNGTKVYLQANVYASGTNPKPWVRTDAMTFNLSARTLSLSGVTDYCDSVEVNSACNNAPQCDLTTAATSNPSGLIISTTSPTTLTHLKIFSLGGSVEWSSTVPLSTNPATVALQRGLYIVAGYSNGLVTCTKKVVVD